VDLRDGQGARPGPQAGRACPGGGGGEGSPGRVADRTSFNDAGTLRAALEPGDVAWWLDRGPP